MSKGFITKISNLGTAHHNGSITVNESIQGTICAVHNVMKGGDGFPMVQHQMLEVRPRNSCRVNSSSPTRRRKSSCSRSRSRSRNDCQQIPTKEWTVKASTVYHNFSAEKGEPDQHQGLMNNVTIAKSDSCPCPVSASMARQCSCSGKNPKSRSVLEVPCISPHIAEHIYSTDEVVNGLKREIENVKSQLMVMRSAPEKKSSTSKDPTAKQVYQLSKENKHLRKELEQKRQLYQATVKEMHKSKDILSEYEKQVGLLHEQAIKSSKVMKQSKEKFCQCIKQKDNMIDRLKRQCEELHRVVGDKEMKYESLRKSFDDLQVMYVDNTKQYDLMTEQNQNVCECLKLMEGQLEASVKEVEYYKSELDRMDKLVADFKCEFCEKVNSGAKQQSDKYEERIKELENKENVLKDEIASLNEQLNDTANKEGALKELREKCACLEEKLEGYQKYMAKCQDLEDEYQQQCREAIEKESKYLKERDELRSLVEELTAVVQQNKVTLLQLSEINKEQEALILSQGAVLSEKEEKMKSVESEIDCLKRQSLELEQEVEDLRQALSGPCTKDTCLSLSHQLDDLKVALDSERDNKLVKEKIIEDQSHTIQFLQQQIKDRIAELNRFKEETSITEKEMMKVSRILDKKQEELDHESKEKEQLAKKLKNVFPEVAVLSKAAVETRSKI
ncbi:unnamed protein product [Acanthoscelides obtectus]|uniref:Uncharacterized protein n=1 Tax=Acanthoscelides obtectus TaxID=200917 RepID=A0A9P0Q038_ACAOB|nr:unnamed protein product [Acanthoscelides obtectus]CAK1647771.1 hypothetical protein AOBTE_LOCUS15389 [Acanthoscelides obtectus]